MPALLLRCPRCDTQLDSTVRFCTSCGADMQDAAARPTTNAGGASFVVERREEEDPALVALRSATIGDYDIYGELGRGGMATVYLALDLALNRQVAIKTLLAELLGRVEMVARFKREAQTAAALSHPHIVQIYAVKETPGSVYFVMKYIDGRSLESTIAENGRLDVAMTRVILRQVGDALAFAHKRMVVHRDIKPANVMLDQEGWAIVTDFGIAKVLEASVLTATGAAIGTPHYMSPEQFANEAITGRSDQYSFGIMAYEMLTGTKPFDATNYPALVTQHLMQEPPDIRKLRDDVPRAMADVIKRMMAKKAEDRFVDMDDALAALEGGPAVNASLVRTQIIDIAKSGPQRRLRISVPVSPIPLGGSPRKVARTEVKGALHASGQRRRTIAVASAAAAVAVALILGVALLRPSSPTNSVPSEVVTPAVRVSSKRALEPARLVGSRSSTGRGSG